MPYARSDRIKFYAPIPIHAALGIVGLVGMATERPVLAVPFAVWTIAIFALGNWWCDRCLIHWGWTQEEADRLATEGRSASSDSETPQ